MFKLDDCVGFVTNKEAKKIVKAFSQVLSYQGITRTQWIALYYLSISEYINQSELADTMNVEKSTMARLIDRMEKEGYVKREKHESDRRITYIRLTDVGRQRNKDLMPFGEDFNNTIIRDITEEDLDIFKKVLNKLVENAEKGK